MSGEPKTLTPEQEKAAREAFETRYKAFSWWTERYGTQHPALRKDENGDYLEEGQRKYWTGFQEGYAAALGVPVVARDEAAELRAENAQLRADLREYVEDGFLQGAHRQEDGGYSTGGISTYRDLGDWLVEHAGWTRREGGVGRMQVYDPPRRLAGGENEK